MNFRPANKSEVKRFSLAFEKGKDEQLGESDHQDQYAYAELLGYDKTYVRVVGHDNSVRYYVVLHCYQKDVDDPAFFIKFRAYLDSIAPTGQEES